MGMFVCLLANSWKIRQTSHTASTTKHLSKNSNISPSAFFVNADGKLISRTWEKMYHLTAIFLLQIYGVTTFSRIMCNILLGR